ncbi:MAG: 23S rRNA (guanosine(2251)-2'-O)-methyltransferase RlmB [Acidobacteria bacterium]|nr:23S rRNA (guanosine(2251)-2'-O)-methyltransferase RlmB [Acidobacteriota bacterium]
MSVIFGVNPVLEALRGERRPVERIAIATGVRIARFDELMKAARAAGVPVARQPPAALDRASGTRNHQGVVAVVGSAAYAELDAVIARMADCKLVVLLDGVEDPHNLGAILRTAECAGAAGVVVPARGQVGLTETVAKTSAGALEHIPVARVTNLVRAMETLKQAGAWIAGLDGGADTAYTAYDFDGPTALVFGGEGRGLRRLVRERCDVLLAVPMYGAVTSLNVSVTVGVVLFEARRRMRGR